MLVLSISYAFAPYSFASKDSGKYSSYLSRSLSGTTVAGSNSEGAKWHLNRSQFGIRIDHDLAVFFKVVVAFCNKITLCSLFFWIQVDF